MTNTTFSVMSDTTPNCPHEVRWMASTGETGIVAADLSGDDAMAAINLCVAVCRNAGFRISGPANRTVHASPAEILGAIRRK